MEIVNLRFQCMSKATTLLTNGRRNIKSPPDIKEIVKVAKVMEKYVTS